MQYLKGTQHTKKGHKVFTGKFYRVGPFVDYKTAIGPFPAICTGRFFNAYTNQAFILSWPIVPDTINGDGC